MGFNDFMTKLFGNKAQRDIKAIRPFVEQINKIYPQMAALSNDELRAKTQVLKQEIQASAADLRKEIDDIKAQIEKTEIQDRAPLFEKIDKLEAQILEVYDHKLDEILPTVYAIVKDTCRRFREAKSIEDLALTPTDFDREAVMRYPGVVEIVDDKVLIHEVYDGAPNIWIPYDCQLFGGVVLHQGKIAEMMTGEGKTLTSILPVFLNALTGNGVHVVTVNDYLAKRDSEWNSPVFLFHQMNVDCIDKHQPNSAARRKAYQAEVTYGTNNEFGFDYLRDNMAMRPEDLVQRSHNYAIVDEVDSVLIDDARTPLIISGPVPKGDDQMFDEFCPYIEKLVEVQRRQTTQYLSEAKKLIDSDDQKDIEAGFLSLFRAYKSLPKNKALIKYLSEPGIKTGLLKTEEIYMENNNRRMPEAVEPLYFVCDEKQKSVEMTDKGNQLIADIVKDDSFFVLPDITSQLSELEAQHLPEEEYITKKDELMQDYAVKSERVHTMQQLLKAYTMFEIDDDYVVMDGEVKIVDEQTGRIMEGRRWSDGLHQAVEAKEHVKVEAATQTYATITLQNYFRMYHKLAGMTGTAITEAGEFWDIYKLDVVEIPTNVPVIRDDQNDRVYKTNREKYKAVIEEIEKLVAAGRPVLVGTTSVEISEMLSKMLNMRKIPHNVLNAKLHAREADIVKDAGQTSRVTIATNMAGRGTDIKLSPEVRAAGGLAIIGTERHESRRVDRQLRGRAGRQGDPGSSVFYVSLEDKLMRLFASDRISKIMDRMGFEEGEMIEHPMINKSIERAQKKVEENNFGIRKRLLEYDDVMNKQRKVIYERRRHALMGERIGMDISNIIWDRVNKVIMENDYDGCKESFFRLFAMEFPFTAEQFEDSRERCIDTAYDTVLDNFKKRAERLANTAWPVIKNVYEEKGNMYENILIPLTDGHRGYQISVPLKEAYDQQATNIFMVFEKLILLHTIDEAWQENLRLLDELKHSVQNASYEQKDPLLIFKLESVNLFDNMINEINDGTISVLMRCSLPVANPEEVRQAPAQQREPQRRYVESKQDLSEPSETQRGMQQAASGDTRSRQQVVQTIRNEGPKIGRNDPCPCGSGKKFKNCHGRGL
ncbi:MAG: preprotein translocase subunit SecA [Bacteroidaceae bacterium]|jgi:preprotein translocase subunit SecA|nr:preprotein translocase subunit SecA [Bacteroidaceae bacterium]